MAIDYATLKLVHVTCVVASGVGFALRGALALADAPVMRRRWVRVVPHLVDTLLLGSAIWMAVMAHLNPTQHPWLGTKIVLLGVYVVLGGFALRRARTRATRIAAYVGALAVFAWIVGIALTRRPALLFDL